MHALAYPMSLLYYRLEYYIVIILLKFAMKRTLEIGIGRVIITGDKRVTT